MPNPLITHQKSHTYTYNLTMWSPRNPKKLKISHYGGLSVSSAIATFLNFFSGLIIASALGPTGRGTYQLVKNYQSLVPSFLNLSLGSIYTSQIEDVKLGLAKYKYHLIISWIIATVVIIRVPLYESIPNSSKVLLAVSFPAFFVSNLTTSIFLRRKNITNYVKYYWVTNVGSPVLIILLMLVGCPTFFNLVLALTIPNVVNFIWSSGYLRSNKDYQVSIYKQKKSIATVHFSSFSRVLITLSDQIVIVTFAGINNLGIYMVAFAFGSIFSIFTGPAISLVPVWSREPGAIEKRKRQYFMFIGIATITAITIGPKAIDIFVSFFKLGEFEEISRIYPIIALGILTSALNEFLLAQAIYRGKNNLLIFEKIIHVSAIALFVALMRNEESLLHQSFFILTTSFPSLLILIGEDFFFKGRGGK